MKLPKGFEVTYHINDTNKNRAELESEKITYHINSDKTLAVKCFITGDEDKGLAVVTLDNPELCVIEVSNDYKRKSDVRKLLRRGYLLQNEMLSFYASQFERLLQPPPECHY